jgi:hypothetical protein
MKRTNLDSIKNAPKSSKFLNRALALQIFAREMPLLEAPILLAQVYLVSEKIADRDT